MLDVENGVVLLDEGEGTLVLMDYVNHRGERRNRKVCPVTLFWGSTEWHPEPGLMLTAYDVGKQEFRDFAVKDIHGVERVVRGTEE